MVTSVAGGTASPASAPPAIYAQFAPRYLQAGYSPLPLPSGRKHSPPTGYTGQDGKMATEAEVRQWSADRPDANIGLRLPKGVIGVDVDAYKGPEAQAAWNELVATLGPLPEDAPWFSSRGDGLSGIRLLKVPEDFRPRDMARAGEVIHFGHRYVIGPPSIHPTGQRYAWVNMPPGANWTMLHVDSLPSLPEPWLDGLRARSGRVLIGGTSEPAGWSSPDIPRLLREGIPPGQVQDEVLRDVCWLLARQGAGQGGAWRTWSPVPRRRAGLLAWVHTLTAEVERLTFRWLGYIPFGQITDQRSAEPVIRSAAPS